MEAVTEAEAQRIFANAARASTVPPPDGGRSLGKLHEIGRAACLDPDAALDRAAGLTAHQAEPATPGAEPLLDVPDDKTISNTSALPTRRTRA